MTEEHSAENGLPHCPTCTCGCTCGFGGEHLDNNPRCDLNRRDIPPMRGSREQVVDR